VLKKVETTENYPMLYLLVNKEKNDWLPYNTFKKIV
jgi:hypothetical protein